MTATVGNIVGMIQGEKKYKEGKKMMREAQRLIDEFEWQDLDDSQISTIGSEFRQEEAARTTSTAMDTIRSGGTRGILGATGYIQANNNALNKEITAYLDEQQKMLDARNVAMIETRQQGELAGYGNMLNVGMGLKYGGIADYYNATQAQSAHAMEVVGTIMSGGIGGGGGNAATSQAATNLNIQPQGVTQPSNQSTGQIDWMAMMKAIQG